jgi:hypothetical protein
MIKQLNGVGAGAGINKADIKSYVHTHIIIEEQAKEEYEAIVN